MCRVFLFFILGNLAIHYGDVNLDIESLVTSGDALKIEEYDRGNYPFLSEFFYGLKNFFQYFIRGSIDADQFIFKRNPSGEIFAIKKSYLANIKVPKKLPENIPSNSTLQDFLASNRRKGINVLTEYIQTNGSFSVLAGILGTVFGTVLNFAALNLSAISRVVMNYNNSGKQLEEIDNKKKAVFASLDGMFLLSKPEQTVFFLLTKFFEQYKIEYSENNLKEITKFLKNKIIIDENLKDFLYCQISTNFSNSEIPQKFQDQSLLIQIVEFLHKKELGENPDPNQIIKFSFEENENINFTNPIEISAEIEIYFKNLQKHISNHVLQKTIMQSDLLNKVLPKSDKQAITFFVQDILSEISKENKFMIQINSVLEQNFWDIITSLKQNPSYKGKLKSKEDRLFWFFKDIFKLDLAPSLKELNQEKFSVIEQKIAAMDFYLNHGMYTAEYLQRNINLSITLLLPQNLEIDIVNNFHSYFNVDLNKSLETFSAIALNDGLALPNNDFIKAIQDKGNFKLPYVISGILKSLNNLKYEAFSKRSRKNNNMADLIFLVLDIKNLIKLAYFNERIQINNQELRKFNTDIDRNLRVFLAQEDPTTEKIIQELNNLGNEKDKRLEVIKNNVFQIVANIGKEVIFQQQRLSLNILYNLLSENQDFGASFYLVLEFLKITK